MSDLQQLKACSEASKELQKVIEQNRLIAEFNSEQDKKQGLAHVIWGKRKKEREDLQTAWDDRRLQIKNSLLGEEIAMGCGGCGTNRKCDGGYSAKREQGCGFLNMGCEQICNRNDSTADREATQQVTNEKGPRPANFNEPEPRKNQGDYYHKNVINVPPINVQCCSNAINVNTAGQSSAELQNISQKCNQEIEQKIQNLQNTTQPIGTQVATTQPVTSQEIVDESLVLEETPIPIYKNPLYIGGAIGSLSLIFCCLLILIFLLN